MKNIDLESETLELDFTMFDAKSKNLTELKPGGKSINVTEKNKLEYIELSVKKLVEKGQVFQQLFVDEFHKVQLFFFFMKFLL